MKHVKLFEEFVNEANGLINESVEKTFTKAASDLKKYDYIEPELDFGEVGAFAINARKRGTYGTWYEGDFLLIFDDGKGNFSALLAKVNYRFTEFFNGTQNATYFRGWVPFETAFERVPLSKLNNSFLKKMMNQAGL